MTLFDKLYCLDRQLATIVDTYTMLGAPADVYFDRFMDTLMNYIAHYSQIELNKKSRVDSSDQMEPSWTINASGNQENSIEFELGKVEDTNGREDFKNVEILTRDKIFVVRWQLGDWEQNKKIASFIINYYKTRTGTQIKRRPLNTLTTPTHFTKSLQDKYKEYDNMIKMIESTVNVKIKAFSEDDYTSENMCSSDCWAWRITNGGEKSMRVYITFDEINARVRNSGKSITPEIACFYKNDLNEKVFEIFRMEDQLCDENRMALIVGHFIDFYGHDSLNAPIGK